MPETKKPSESGQPWIFEKEYMSQCVKTGGEKKINGSPARRSILGLRCDQAPREIVEIYKDH